jgi:hypothetical protein
MVDTIDSALGNPPFYIDKGDDNRLQGYLCGSMKWSQDP